MTYSRSTSHGDGLEGVGATIALPLLDAMNPAATGAGADDSLGSTPSGSPSSGSRMAPSWTDGRRRSRTTFDVADSSSRWSRCASSPTIVSSDRETSRRNAVLGTATSTTWSTCVKPWTTASAGARRLGVSADQLAARHIGLHAAPAVARILRPRLVERDCVANTDTAAARKKETRARCFRSCSVRATPTRSAAILHETGSILDRVRA